MIAYVAALLCALASAFGQPKPAIRVIAHRGEHLHHRENTLAAFQAAIDAGADYFELDVRTTRDGRLVLMHDARVDRTTDGHGEVSQMSFDEMRRFGVPAFSEALALAKGRCGVYVDIKNARPEDLVREVEGSGMGIDAVFYGGRDTLIALHRLRPDWRVMPEAAKAETLERAIEILRPEVIAFDARDFTGDLIARAKRAGALIFVDRLGPNDNATAWEDAIQRGADGIQTDHPAELVGFLKQRKGVR